MSGISPNSSTSEVEQNPLSNSPPISKPTTCRRYIDKDSQYGRVPLSWTARSGHEAVVKLLLETSKVEVDSKDS